MTQDGRREGAPAEPAAAADDDRVGRNKPPRRHFFKAGASGNPAGRRAGVRNRITMRFLEALCADFEEHGVAVIERVRLESPAAYLRVVAKLVPAHLVVHEETRLDELSDGEVATYLAALRGHLALRHELEQAGGAALGDEPLGVLPALPEAESVP